ncbi:hypothetical protein AAA799P11_00059 [Marine Group I thaumarchaeote SCGC AAA799-P11]|uniref:Uncharacterized protein n=4 Tax=Marine Group I TaxID=905826 RepID=A0A087S3K8_9ARCH|nr:hypothetical protein AAA799N04_01849 [Marine Group I thaumarchaeote SCGC AAA799-N04]KFM14703.1 hypothetical protein AAA799D11_01599 [Marine Group I thaumarchaeote SCGC AAA799-D11]KFM15722.1 hypothetical protein SCCGRSA3_02599 [Marine Group I thaumarchaeote SCGC RSA3]KFM20312.1 hypothetical protein AAA799P11_00059 [Marine Group I thaumarchaeote SCGC AAA799-P11]
MDLKKEQQVVRLALVISIISGVGYVVFLSFDAPNSSNNALLGTEILFSGFGEITLFNPEQVTLFSTDIYQDTSLGYQVSKPNGNWEIHSVLNEMNSDELALLQAKGFLDGVYVEQNHDKRFIITVFDIQKENFSLHEYVDDIIESTESQNIEIPFEQVSSEDDWAIFAMSSLDQDQYGEQLFVVKDNRLYMLLYSGASPESLSLEQKQDFQYIMESFEVI